MKSRKTVSFMIFLLLLSAQLFAKAFRNDDISKWILAREDNGISIYYRWIENYSMKMREMRALFVIQAEVSEILPLFSNTENYLKWASGIKECSIQNICDSTWVTYTLKSGNCWRKILRFVPWFGKEVTLKPCMI